MALLCFAMASSHAQDNLGISASNYSPTNTVLINPSSIIDSKAYIDINLVGLGVYAHNNLVYLPKDGFNFFSQVKNPTQVPDIAFRTDRKKYKALSDVNVHGPSFTFAAGNHAFGLYTGVRTVVDARGLPGQTSIYATDGLQYSELFGVPQSARNVKVNALGWGEVGINYGTIISKRENDITTFGISIKRLFGVAGGAVRLDQWDYTVLDSTQLETETLKGKYGFNFPAFNSGTGWGVDVGFTYKRTLSDVTTYSPHHPSSNCKTCDYKYKFAVAILDVGRIKFKPEFYYNEFSEADSTVWNGYTSLDAGDAGDAAGLDAAIQSELGLVNDAGDKAKFRMMLPTALSAQFDYNLGYNFYLNATGIFGVPWTNSFGAQRGAQLAITPRYEIKRFEVALPLILHEYQHPSFGAMIRLNSIVIGTDRLGTYLFNRDVYGADIYFNIKYTIFRNWRCKQKDMRKAPKVKTQKRAAGSALPCPSW